MVNIKRILMIFSMLLSMVFAFVPGAQAASLNEVDSFKSNVVKIDGQEWLRLEFKMDRKGIDYEVSTNPIKPKQLTVKLKNTDEWDNSGEVLDTRFARYMTAKKKGHDLEIMVSFAKTLEEQSYNVYTIEPGQMIKDKKGKEKKYKGSAKLIVEIAQSQLGGPLSGDYGSVEGVKGWKITIDPGHGGSDTGARNPNGYTEKEATLAISKYVQSILGASGANVSMTREDDRDVYGLNATDSQELQARVDVGEENRADLFICIHCNASAGSHAASGTETYYFPGSSRSRYLAECINNEIVDAIGLDDRGAKTARFYVLKYSSMPAVLVETAFIDNRDDVELLSTPRSQQEFALAICKGISQYTQKYSKR